MIILAVFVDGNAFAADTSDDFSAANRLYAEGKFADAAGAYDKIRQSIGQSPALLFNLGNAEFKAGHLGKAIAAYRRAEQIAPRDAELRANLAFVRGQVQGTTVRESRWQDWLNTLTLNEGAALTAVLFWLAMGLLVAAQIKPSVRPALRKTTHATLLLTLISTAVLALQANNHFNQSIAVVTASEAAARSGPFEDGQSVFTVRDGAELKILQRHEDWVQVSNGAGKIGWLSKKQTEVLPGA